MRTFKRYCKAPLKRFYIKKFVMMLIKIIYMIDFIVSNQNFTPQHLKILKIPVFLVIFVQNFRFFSLKCQIQGFQVFWQPCKENDIIFNNFKILF